MCNKTESLNDITKNYVQVLVLQKILFQKKMAFQSKKKQIYEIELKNPSSEKRRKEIVEYSEITFRV